MLANRNVKCGQTVKIQIRLCRYLSKMLNENGNEVRVNGYADSVSCMRDIGNKFFFFFLAQLFLKKMLRYCHSPGFIRDGGGMQKL